MSDSVNPTTYSGALFIILQKWKVPVSANARHQRPEPAADGQPIQAELNGWLGFAECCVGGIPWRYFSRFKTSSHCPAIPSRELKVFGRCLDSPGKQNFKSSPLSS